MCQRVRVLALNEGTTRLQPSGPSRIRCHGPRGGRGLDFFVVCAFPSAPQQPPACDGLGARPTGSNRFRVGRAAMPYRGVSRVAADCRSSPLAQARPMGGRPSVLILPALPSCLLGFTGRASERWHRGGLARVVPRSFLFSRSGLGKPSGGTTRQYVESLLKTSAWVVPPQGLTARRAPMATPGKITGARRVWSTRFCVAASRATRSRLL